MDGVKKSDVQWAYNRAIEYANRGEMKDAIASAISDLGKIGVDRTVAATVLLHAKNAAEFEKLFKV